jgi:hypothetical protein
MTEVPASMLSCSARCRAQIGPGHVGTTPQPKATVASDHNQRRRFRKSGISNLTGSNQRSGESIDTVGVNGSIPVSPTYRAWNHWLPVVSGPYFVPTVTTERQV